MRQHHEKPVTPSQRPTNFIVPLLGSDNVSGAVPVFDFVLLENSCEADHELAVLT
jgi:hypothetical protein